MTTLESLAKKLYEKGISINELIKVFDNYVKENFCNGNGLLKPKQSIEDLANKMAFVSSCSSREIEKIQSYAGMIDDVFLQLIHTMLKEELSHYIAVGYKQYGDDYPTIIKPSEWIYLKINVKEDFASYGDVRYQRVRFRKLDIDELKQELEELERAELYKLISTKYREEVENLIREEIENLISDDNADNQEPTKPKKKSKNEQRDNDFKQWLDETEPKPDFEGMTKEELHNILIQRNGHLWRPDFNGWVKHTKLYNGVSGRRKGR